PTGGAGSDRLADAAGRTESAPLDLDRGPGGPGPLRYRLLPAVALARDAAKTGSSARPPGAAAPSASWIRDHRPRPAPGLRGPRMTTWPGRVPLTWAYRRWNVQVVARGPLRGP